MATLPAICYSISTLSYINAESSSNFVWALQSCASKTADQSWIEINLQNKQHAFSLTCSALSKAEEQLEIE